MRFEHFLKKHFHSVASGGVDESGWLQELLEYRARENDNELKNQLLKELVLKYSAAEKELLKLNRELTEKQNRLDDDLKAAAGIQNTLLPKQLPELDSLKMSWKFLPCQLIGGDIFNVLQLDDDHFALYMIDVSGHGVPAALVTVSVSQSLHPDSGLVRKAHAGAPPSFEITAPRSVLKALDEQYPLERFDMFFTMIYAVLNIRQGSMVYGTAGHPPPVLLHADGDLELLGKGGPIIGMGGLAPFAEECRHLSPGDKVIFYTDGILEYESPRAGFYGKERFHEILTESRDQPIALILNAVMESMMRFGDDCEPQDDVSLLGIEVGAPPAAL